MSQSVLISSPDTEWSKDLKESLLKAGHQCSLAFTGKECQQLLHKSKFSLVLLDIDTNNHSGIEVLKFLKITTPSTKVTLCFKNKDRWRELNFDPKLLIKMGSSKSFIRPFVPQAILQFLDEIKNPGKWRDIPSNASIVPTEEVMARISDGDCTSIKIQSFISDNVAIFDFYIRISSNKFIKILKEGERFEPERIHKYASDGVEFLYFLNKDRLTYINFMNEMTKVALSSHKKHSSEKVLGTLRNISDKLIEEVHTKGLEANLVYKRQAYSRNTYEFIKKNDALKTILNNCMDMNPAAHSHVFLVSFFSSLICSNVPWVGVKTREAVVLGSFIHDLGMLKLPSRIREKSISELSTEELELLRQHPRLGAEMLVNVSGISHQVIQIVHQHHELTTGTGFPHGLSASKIYPLAKIVSLADAFTDVLIENKVTPIEGLKILLQDREKMINYDPICLKALANSFIKVK